MSAGTPHLRLAGISKSYPGVVALRDARLEASRGEAVALMGANGAGKSTLMGVLGGVLQKDQGSIVIDGQPVSIRSPREASALGIAFVHQELSMFPAMSVAENVHIDEFPTRRGLIDKTRMREAARELLAMLGSELSVDAPVETFSTGDRQIVEIARALRRQPRIVIFDEPTSSLTDRERARLFDVIRGLKQRGVVVIYITHFLDEIFKVCDRVTVMRNGETVAEDRIASVRPKQVVEWMLGTAASTERLARPPTGAPRATMVEVRGLSRRGRLRDVSFDLRAGEVVGLWGLLGSGRTELVRALVGLDPIDAGELRYREGDALVPITPKRLHRLVGLVTEDRRGEGLFLPLSVASNLALPSLRGLLGKAGLVDGRRQEALADSLIARLRIKVSGRNQIVATLSGGNQQKVVVGKWLATEPRIFLLDEPTRGLDVNAKAEILQLTAELARSGATVLIVSSELEELMRVCDRYLIISRGRILGDLEAATTTEEDLMRAVSVGEEVTP